LAGEPVNTREQRILEAARPFLVSGDRRGAEAARRELLAAAGIPEPREVGTRVSMRVERDRPGVLEYRVVVRELGDSRRVARALRDAGLAVPESRAPDAVLRDAGHERRPRLTGAMTARVLAVHLLSNDGGGKRDRFDATLHVEEALGLAGREDFDREYRRVLKLLEQRFGPMPPPGRTATA
jgi:hypothetical protein